MNSQLNITNFIRVIDEKTQLGEILWVDQGGCYKAEYDGEIYVLSSIENDKIMIIFTDIPSLYIKAEKLTIDRSQVIFWSKAKHLYNQIKQYAKEDVPHEQC